MKATSMTDSILAKLGQSYVTFLFPLIFQCAKGVINNYGQEGEKGGRHVL